MSTLPAQRQTPDVSAIIHTDDPQILDLAARLMNMPTESKIETLGAATAFVESERAEFEKRIEHDSRIIMVLRALLLHEIVENGGKALPHDTYDVHIERSKTLTKDIATLRQLEGKVPEAELAPALYLKQAEPQWVADGNKLNALLRQYGENSEIGKIIRAGCQATFGPPKLVFKEREAKLKVVR